MEFVFAPGRDTVPEGNETVEYNGQRGAGGVFANFMQGMTAKYSKNTDGYRTDFYRNTLARLFVRVNTSEMNLFLGTVTDDHTRERLVPRLVGNPAPRQENRISGGAANGDATAHAEETVSTNGYLDFFIRTANMPLQEKMDLKETLADNYVAYFFGQAPPVWGFSGWLFNSVQDDQATNFLRIYLEILRGTQLARRQKVVSLKIDSYIITGTIVSANFTLESQSETAVPFQFQLLVKRVAIVTYTSGWVPTRADTPFAADPNAIPYDRRRLPRGYRASVAGTLDANRTTQAGPVPDRTTDARTRQPPAGEPPNATEAEQRAAAARQSEVSVQSSGRAETAPQAATPATTAATVLAQSPFPVLAAPLLPLAVTELVAGQIISRSSP